MNRKEIEDKVFGVMKDAKTRIESAPLPAFVAGIVIGVLLGLFYSSVVPLILLILLIVACWWLFSESGGQSSDIGQ